VRLMKLLEDMELHTDAYRMYYVGMSDQRHAAQKQFKQIHVLFIREDHKDVEFCDKHFGSHLRKNNGFAPFRFQGGRWRVFTKARVSDKLMVNLAVAGSASLVNPPTRVYHLESARAGLDTPEREHRLLAPRLAAGNATAPAAEHRHLEADKLYQQMLEAQQVLASALRDHEKATGKVPASKGAGSAPTASQEEEKKGWLKKWVLKPGAKPGAKDSANGDLQPDGEVGLQLKELKVHSRAFRDGPEPELNSIDPQSSGTWRRVSYTTKRTKDGSEMVTSIRMMPQGDPTTA